MASHTGGAVASQVCRVTRHILDLGGEGWYFGRVSRRPFAAPQIYDLPAVTEWLPATVPGNVRTDLLAQGRIPDPFFGEDYQRSLWVEEVDWWYRRQIEIDSLHAGQRVFLILDGIDYLSAVFVNEQELVRHEGMFSRQVTEITVAFQQETKAELAVRLWGSSALQKRKLTRIQQIWQKISAPLYRSWVGIYPDRSATLKCQMSFGWDFAPPIRTMGIWDQLRLVVTGPVAIIEASALGRPNLRSEDSQQWSLVSAHCRGDSSASPQNDIILTFGATNADSQSPSQRGGFRGGQAAPTTPPANLHVNLTLDADHICQVEATVQVSPANFKGPTPDPYIFRLDLPPGQSSHPLACRLPEAALWQPWDRGHPNLYHVQITLAGSDGTPLDEITLRTGFRTVDLGRWQFSVNGQSEFIRGLNWVPADSFPGRLRRDDYARLLATARHSGANLLRVWGGGLREKQAFYDLCDELGLLVWQEFPFACMFLGSYPRDAVYLSLVKSEGKAIVRRLRDHPSVAVWCGGNEFSQRRNRPLLDTLAMVVDREDGTRPFIHVSPSFDHGRDAHHWHVWHGNAPIRAYQTETARFLSEFGLQALPGLDTLRAALPVPATGWQSHLADLKKLQRYTSLFNNQPVTGNGLTDIHNLQFTIHNSQLAQATALQTAIEHMRRRKGSTGGVCLWQFNEPWPAISWAIVDYFGRSKLACERLSNWYNPVLISLKFPVGRPWAAGETFEAEIWAINDSLNAFSDCKLRINLDGVLVHRQTLDLPIDSAGPVGAVTHHLIAPPHQVSLTLHHHGVQLAQNSYDLDWSDESGGGLCLRLKRAVAEWTLR